MITEAVAALAAKYGPEVAIEIAAQAIDVSVPDMHLGDVLRDAWVSVDMASVVGPAVAALSGAESEFEFYEAP